MRDAPDVPAAEHLRYIREMMARSSAFTAVPGWGSVAVGATAVGAAVVAAQMPTAAAWLAVWIGEAALALTLGALLLVRKARRGGVPLRSGAGRKYVLSLLPPLVAGALLTFALAQHGQHALLPPLWLLLYGAGTMTGGAFSVRPVPLMGLAFMAAGVLALLLPAAWADALLGIAFGGFHLGFGLWIARAHGG